MKRLSAVDLAKNFNTVRIESKDKQMSREELFTILRRHNISNNVICGLISRGYIIKHKLGKARTYSLTPNPVHWTVFENIFADNRPVKSKDEDKNMKSDIKRAIALLKSEGYKVFKPETSYTEV